MLQEPVRQAVVGDALRQAMRGDDLVDRGPGPALDDIFFHRDDQLVRLAQLDNTRLIDGLDKAHVDQRGVEFSGDPLTGRDHRAKGEDGNVLALLPELRLAERQRRHFFLYGNARPAAARVAHGRDPFQLIAGIEHLPAFVLVGGRHDHEIGQAAHIAEIIGPVVGRPVCADAAGPVNGEQDRQILHGHIVDQLIIGPLQEGGIDRDHGLQPLAGHPRRHRDAVLLGDGHVIVFVGMFLLKAHQAGALAHGRRDRGKALVPAGHIAGPVAKHLAVGRPAAGARLGDDAPGRVKRRDAVIFNGVILGRAVALALAGNNVQKLRPVELADVPERLDQRRQIVAVQRPDIVEAEFLKQGAGHDHALHMLFGAPGDLKRARHMRQDLLAALAHRGINRAG